LNQWIIEKGQLTITQDGVSEKDHYQLTNWQVFSLMRVRGQESANVHNRVNIHNKIKHVIPDLPVISTEVEKSQITKYDEMIYGFIREILFIKYFGKNISNFEIKQSRITGILYF